MSSRPSGKPAASPPDDEETTVIGGAVFRPGDVVGRYQLQRQLGEGGMGVVFAALDPGLDRRVAVKVLRADDSPEGVVANERLLREAQAMARLAHPNVVAVYELGMAGSHLFIAMELVEGPTLRKWLRTERRSFAQVLDKFLQAGRGLAAAHAVGLVHRDFKPANVLLGSDGRARVTDFGLARSVLPGDDAPRPTINMRASVSVSVSGPSSGGGMGRKLTKEGFVVGTPAYMAPEQEAGETVDARSDQYAFCVCLFEALYGHLPQRQGEPPPPKKKPAATGVPRWVKGVLRRGLSERSENRYGSLQALLDELERHAPRQRRPQPAAWVALAVGLSAAVGGLAWYAGPSQACAREATALSSALAPARVARLSQAFERTQVSSATTAWLRVEARASAYAEAWGQRRAAACLSARDDPKAAGRLACLDERAEEFRALLDDFESASPLTVRRAPVAIDALTPLSWCDRATPAWNSPAQRAHGKELAGLLAETNALYDEGKYEEARVVAAKARARAQEASAGAYEAEAAYHLALATGELGRARDAHDLAGQGALLAQKEQRDALAVRLWLIRAWIGASDLGLFDDAAMDVSHAKNALERLGGDSVLEAHVAATEGIIALAMHRPGDAIPHLERALKLRTSASGERDLNVATLHTMLSSQYRERGELGLAKQHLERALETREQLLGVDHPEYLAVQLERADFLLATRDFPAAQAQYAQVRAAAERSGLTTGNQLPAAHQGVGEALLALGRPKEAVGHFRTALTLRRQEAGLPPQSPALAPCLSGLGRALVDSGAAAEALGPLKQALEALPAGASDPRDVAEVQFALARALAATRAPTRDVVSWADQANALFAKYGRRSLPKAEFDAWYAELGRR